MDTHTLKIIRLPEVKATTSLGRSTLYRHVKAGTFPKPIPLGGDRVGWVESEVQNWIKERIADRDSINPD